MEATQNAGRHWLSNLEEPWLLIINNADDSSLDLPSLFPEGERGHVLVTQETQHSESTILLGPLSSKA